jgi:hypothetical protein
MKTIVLVSAISLALCGALSSIGCSSSSSGTGASTTTTTATGGHSTTSSTTTSSTSTTTTGTPAPPTIGTQIDRIGRPAINTALNHAFDSNATTAGAAKDMYNQDSTPSDWAANWTPQIAANLAILDSLDTVCGNQPGYATPASATSYNTLAGALSGDELWLNTAGTTCTQYLAVEANALGLVTTSDCGGRALSYDVIDVSYSVLAAGSLASPPPVGDGVPANDVAFLTTFPYEAAPH